MQIIKDKKMIDDPWSFVDDEEALKNGDITVSVERWQKNKDQLTKHSGKIGLRLKSTDKVEDFAEDLHHLALIELNFSAFTDGRSFTQAWLLRNRYHYTGEIRAVGKFIVDQVFYLQRNGVNAFSLENSAQLPLVLEKLNDFSVSYQ